MCNAVHKRKKKKKKEKRKEKELIRASSLWIGLAAFSPHESIFNRLIRRINPRESIN